MLEDHPRVCGEKTYYQDSVYTTPGSPPRMRGKVYADGLPQLVNGDHPRVCGEKLCGCV